MKFDRTTSEDEYTKEISIKEFRETGLLLVINSILHVFGLAIVVDESANRMYPAICKFRGFSEQSISKSCNNVYSYLEDNVEELRKDLDE